MYPDRFERDPYYRREPLPREPLPREPLPPRPDRDRYARDYALPPRDYPPRDILYRDDPYAPPSAALSRDDPLYRREELARREHDIYGPPVRDPPYHSSLPPVDYNHSRNQAPRTIDYGHGDLPLSRSDVGSSETRDRYPPPSERDRGRDSSKRDERGRDERSRDDRESSRRYNDRSPRSRDRESSSRYRDSERSRRSDDGRGDRTRRDDESRDRHRDDRHGGRDRYSGLSYIVVSIMYIQIWLLLSFGKIFVIFPVIAFSIQKVESWIETGLVRSPLFAHFFSYALNRKLAFFLLV